jgi:hypothetical protein
MEPQEKKYPYPEGYEHIAEKVAVDVERIRIIDKEIERLRTAPEEGVRWSGKSGHGESNFPLSWKQKSQPVTGHELSILQRFGLRQFAA